MKLRQVEFVCSAPKPAHYPTADRPEVAFAGRSNVGKSSLLNTILERRRIARVSRTPGRTQLINFFNINDALYLVDLPGYGYAKVPTSVRRQWGPMMERYVRGRRTLRAMFVLLDVRHDPTGEDKKLFAALTGLGLPAIVVLTKCDKLSNARVFQRRTKIAKALGLKPKTLIPFSSSTRRGREEVWQAISRVTGLGDEADEADEAEVSDAALPSEVGGQEGDTQAEAEGVEGLESALGEPEE